MLEGLCFAFWCIEGQVELQRALPAARHPPPCVQAPGSHMCGVLLQPRMPQVYSLIAPVTDYLAVITMMDRSS